MSLHELVGLAGAACYLLAYFLVQLTSLGQNDYRIIALNVLGPTTLLYSLLHDFNLPSFIVNLAWLVITLGGVVRRCRRRLSRA